VDVCNAGTSCDLNYHSSSVIGMLWVVCTLMYLCVRIWVGVLFLCVSICVGVCVVLPAHFLLLVQILNEILLLMVHVEQRVETLLLQSFFWPVSPWYSSKYSLCVLCFHTMVGPFRHFSCSYFSSPFLSTWSKLHIFMYVISVTIIKSGLILFFVELLYFIITKMNVMDTLQNLTQGFDIPLNET